MRAAADASSVVAESLRARGLWLLDHDDLILYITPATWSEVTHELGRRLDAMVLRGQIEPVELEPMLHETIVMLSQIITVVPESEYGDHEAEARDRIPRDPNDWPTVALALSMGIGIWTNDRDFFGCGVPVWTTETLLTHLASGRARLER
jgi:predicted nucleic acid-binding protein